MRCYAVPTNMIRTNYFKQDSKTPLLRCSFLLCVQYFMMYQYTIIITIAIWYNSCSSWFLDTYLKINLFSFKFTEYIKQPNTKLNTIQRWPPFLVID